jgi:chromosomal replication initiator protein
MTTPKLADIRAAVCRHFEIAESDLRAGNLSRKRRVTHGRQVAMHLAKRMTTRSLNEIGRQFGIQCHTTVIYAHNAVRDRRQADPAFNAKVRAVVDDLNGGAR